MSQYSEGICEGGAAILKDGQQMPIESIVYELNRHRWRPENEAPKGVPVIVRGGIAMKKTSGEWFSGMEDPLYQRPLQWKPDCWMFIPEPPE